VEGLTIPANVPKMAPMIVPILGLPPTVAPANGADEEEVDGLGGEVVSFAPGKGVADGGIIVGFPLGPPLTGLVQLGYPHRSVKSN
jgi:hypothetical protein